MLLGIVCAARYFASLFQGVLLPLTKRQFAGQRRTLSAGGSRTRPACYRVCRLHRFLAACHLLDCVCSLVLGLVSWCCARCRAAQACRLGAAGSATGV